MKNTKTVRIVEIAVCRVIALAGTLFRLTLPN